MVLAWSAMDLVIALDESATEDGPRDSQEERSGAYRARRPEKVLVRSRERKRQRRPPGGGSPRIERGLRGWLGNLSPASVMSPTHAYALTYGILHYWDVFEYTKG